MIKLEEWLSPRGSQPNCGFISEEDKQDSIRMEYSALEGARISNQDPKGEISTMVVIKWSDAIKGPRVKVDVPLCRGLYMEDHEYIIPWSGTDPDAKIKSFTWSTEENYWIILRYQYNGDFNN